jgi:hypothetical protein
MSKIALAIFMITVFTTAAVLILQNEEEAQ